jgi:hypothetical protein
MAHVYDIDGVSQFHLTPAKAKAAGLFFSVTEHQKVVAKPALEIWKVSEAIKAAMSHRPRDDEDAAAYVRRIKAESYSSAAADLGTAIHDGIQKVLEGSKTVSELEPKLPTLRSTSHQLLRSKGFQRPHAREDSGERKRRLRRNRRLRCHCGRRSKVRS